MVRQEWPYQTRDYKPDPTIQWGRLANGFRYALIPSEEETDRISLRLCIDHGSLDEKNCVYLGLSYLYHRLLHNGGDRLSAEKITELKALWGEEVWKTMFSSWIGQDHMVVKVNLVAATQPHSGDGPETPLELGLDFLRDVSGDLTLDEETFKQAKEEMKLILNGADQRPRSADIRFVEWLTSKRLYRLDSMSKEMASNINMTDGEEFREFMRFMIRPNRMTLIVTGDIEKKRDYIERNIKQLFSNLTNPIFCPPVTLEEKIPFEGLKLNVKKQSDYKVHAILYRMRRLALETDSRENRTREFAEMMSRELMYTLLQSAFEVEGQKEPLKEQGYEPPYKNGRFLYWGKTAVCDTIAFLLNEEGLPQLESLIYQLRDFVISHPLGDAEWSALKTACTHFFHVSGDVSTPSGLADYYARKWLSGKVWENPFECVRSNVTLYQEMEWEDVRAVWEKEWAVIEREERD